MGVCAWGGVGMDVSGVCVWWSGEVVFFGLNSYLD